MALGRTSGGLGTQRRFHALLSPKASKDSAFTACASTLFLTRSAPRHTDSGPKKLQ